MTDVNETVIAALGMQVAQLSIDKAVAGARLEALLGLVKNMLATTEWSTDDNGVTLIMPATEPFMRLHAAVLVQPVTEGYAPTQ